MAKRSAGLLLFRFREGLEVLLVHPGGPFFARKDEGAWTIPKGEIEAEEDPLVTAKREFAEETGFDVPETRFLPLGEIRQKGGKIVLAWAFEGDVDLGSLSSNTFELEWPPTSGRTARFPEIDRAAFFAPGDARVKMNRAQIPFVDRLEHALAEEESSRA